MIDEFERKAALYPLRTRSLQRVLVSAAGVQAALLRRPYFDRIITLEDLAEGG